MTSPRWPAQALPHELDAVVHGPALLARSPGIAAVRRTFPTPGGTTEVGPWSGPVQTAELDGESRTVDPGGQEFPLG